MIKIDYDGKKGDRKTIEKAYWDKFSAQEAEFNKIKSTLKASKLITFFRHITYQDIILGDIKKLVDIFNRFTLLEERFQTIINNEFKDVFSYEQARISQFFEAHNDVFNLKACHYCNMDSVHVYSTLQGYRDESDFIQNASKEELMEVKNIGPKKAEAIISNRSNPVFFDISAVKILQKGLADYKGKNRNHFTLDHFIPQKRCCLFARSLYNFVPSCYTCNSKLKKEKMFCENENELYKYSPTYEVYEQTGNMQFSLFLKSVVNIFDYEKPNKTDFLKKFHIDIKVDNSDNRIVSVLHLQQRYFIHKDKAVRLAYLKEKYSESAIKEIAQILHQSGLSVGNMERDIFNSPSSENESLSKLKRDIMKQLDIKYT